MTNTEKALAEFPDFKRVIGMDRKVYGWFLRHHEAIKSCLTEAAQPDKKDGGFCVDDYTLPVLPDGWEYVQLHHWNPGVALADYWSCKIYRHASDRYIDADGNIPRAACEAAIKAIKDGKE